MDKENSFIRREDDKQTKYQEYFGINDLIWQMTIYATFSCQSNITLFCAIINTITIDLAFIVLERN